MRTYVHQEIRLHKNVQYFGDDLDQDNSQTFLDSILRDKKLTLSVVEKIP